MKQTALADRNFFQVYGSVVADLVACSSLDDLEKLFFDVVTLIGDFDLVDSVALRLRLKTDWLSFSTDANAGRTIFCFDDLNMDSCLCGTALANGSEGFVASTQNSAPACYEQADEGSVCLFPISANGRKMGLLLVTTCEGKHLSSEETMLIEKMCDLMGKTASRELHHQEERVKADDLDTVYRIGAIVTSKLTLREMVGEIVSLLKSIIDTDEVNLTLYDKEKEELSFLARYFENGERSDKPETYKLSDGMNSYIVKNRKPLLIRDDTKSACARLGIRHGGKPAKSWLGVPLEIQDDILGVLTIQSYKKSGLYDKRSVELLKAVAGQCAVAVRNAGLFEEVVKREEEKERLYFSLTHDFLSLVNPITGFAKLIKSLPAGTDAEQYNLFSDQISASADKLVRFVEDILVWSKIRSGALTLNIERADLSLVAISACMVYEPESLLRKIDVTINGEPIFGKNRRLPATMADIDVVQMERVFLNLIGNGVKHANRKIDIGISVMQERMHCSVRDDGRGVNVNKLGSIFDDYVQVNDKNSGAMKGVGLGLPIVRRIIELHCGAITADSNVGGGFCVDFSIPRTLADRKNANRTGR